MKRFYLFLIITLFISSCANYKMNYSKDSKDWETSRIAPIDQPIKHTMYLIGDAGNNSTGTKLPTLALLKQKLAKSGKNSSILFLGSQVYPKGMPKKSKEKDRDLAEYQLDEQLDILKDFKGEIIFTPGTYDWKKYGLKGLKRQAKYIDKKLNAGIEDEDDWKNYFFPEDACSGPEVIEINDQLVVVVVDSQWYLSDWDEEPEINDGCEIKSRKDFRFFFEEIVRKNRNKNVVIAMHHPMYSYGPHGGFFSGKDHLFPITKNDKTRYIPLPVLGSMVAFYRLAIGNKGDLSHKNYKELHKDVMAGATKNGSFIFASGHEHSMQYINEERQHFIVSGSGSIKTAATASKGAEFAYGETGFSQIDFYEDGSAWLQFWKCDESTPEGKIVFRKKIKDKLEISEDNIPESFPEFDEQLKTKVSPVVTNKVEEKGGFHYFFLGEHYRNIYSRTFEFPVLDLTTYKGGLTPVKRGGGNQTNSLRLEDPNGQEYVMRALTKDASRTVPYPVNKMTAANGIVQETFLSSHPFAALAIAPLADAVNIYHTNPALYYVPKQPTLGIHNDLFGGEVYLVEERAGGNWKNEASLGNSKKIISTGDMAEKLTKSHKYKVDQQWLLRSRLFDQVIGDWDRHDDQWRWATIKVNKDSIVYRAIPRDRDQPFSKYDGLVIGFARLFMPFLRQLKVYEPDIKNMKWSSWSPKYVDNSFLNEMSWEYWEKEAKFIQENLTDEIIDQAFDTWPKEAQELTAEEIKSVMKKRRDNLVRFAKMHYDLLYKKVDVYGTEKDELFQIERLDDENTRVRVYHKKKEGNRLVFDRTFQNAVTKEIDIYGLGDDDDFVVSGDVHKSVLIRLIGGLGKDKFVDESKVDGLSKKTRVYDNLEENDYELGSEAKNLSSNNRENNTYDRRAFHYEYNYTIPLPNLGYNPDDGFYLGLNTLTTTYKFKKAPYAAIHRFSGDIAFATLGLDLTYTGDFMEAIGKWNLLLAAIHRTDRSSFSFYGLGNDTPITDDDFNYNRVRQSITYLHPALKKQITALGQGFTIGPLFERSSIEETDGRFITEGETNLPDNIFDSRLFAGARAGLDIISVNNLQIPTKGIKFLANATWMTDLKATDEDFTMVNTELSVFQNIDPGAKLVLASRLGVSHRIGDYPFYHSAVLGGNTNLRGFRADRFYGTTAFYQTTDLRLTLINSVNKILPFTLGLMGGIDYGRVWQKGEDSETWHTGYGGGLWFAPIDFIVLNFGYFIADEEERFSFKVGFDF
jgi:surface antigen Omp85-like protein